MNRAQYLELLDGFLMQLAGDSQMGVILGFEEKHGAPLNALIRYRSILDKPDPGRQARSLDAIRDVEGALARLRDRIRDTGGNGR